MRPATLRFFLGLLTPGGVLLAAAWALQREPVVRDAAAPYALYFAVGALTTAVLLSWYHDLSGLLSVAVTAVLTVSAVERWSGDGRIAALAAFFLLPVNFALFAAWRECGVRSAQGLLKLIIVFAETAAIVWMAEHPEGFLFVLRWTDGSFSVPLAVHGAFAAAILALAALVVRRRTGAEAGLLWALVAIYLGVIGIDRDQTLRFYAGAAGLVLVLTVLEQGYDVANRDELTGLPGRRAFNTMMGQLGRTYAIAMCDVDHFKRFNDSYGHDAGDQVLRMVAARLSEVGGNGRVFRYGGEEFLVVFRGRSATEAAPFVESVRKTIADAGFVLRSPDRPARKPAKHVPSADPDRPRITVSITISIGLAERSQRHSTPELVLDAADAALYRAKEAGRNCVTVADSTPKV